MHSSDSFVGYHGRSNRGKVDIDWSLGRVDGLIPSPPPSPSLPPSSGDDSSLSGGAVAGIVIAVVAAFALIVRAALQP